MVLPLRSILDCEWVTAAFISIIPPWHHFYPFLRSPQSDSCRTLLVLGLPEVSIGELVVVWQSFSVLLTDRMLCFSVCQMYQRWSRITPFLLLRRGDPASLTCPPTPLMRETLPGKMDDWSIKKITEKLWKLTLSFILLKNLGPNLLQGSCCCTPSVLFCVGNYCYLTWIKKTKPDNQFRLFKKNNKKNRGTEETVRCSCGTDCFVCVCDWNREDSLRTAMMSAMASPFRVPEAPQATADVVQDGPRSEEPPGCGDSVLLSYDVTQGSC